MGAWRDDGRMLTFCFLFQLATSAVPSCTLGGRSGFWVFTSAASSSNVPCGRGVAYFIILSFLQGGGAH